RLGGLHVVANSEIDAGAVATTRAVATEPDADRAAARAGAGTGHRNVEAAAAPAAAHRLRQDAAGLGTERLNIGERLQHDGTSVRSRAARASEADAHRTASRACPRSERGHVEASDAAAAAERLRDDAEGMVV